MVAAIPKSVIDSWDDLYWRPDVRIMTTDDSPFKQFADLDESEMAKNFKNRTDFIKLEDTEK